MKWFILAGALAVPAVLGALLCLQIEEGARRAERAWATVEADRARAVVDAELAELARANRDWAGRDAAYAFMEAPGDAGFEADALHPARFALQGLGAVAFVAADATPRWSRGLDPATRSLTPLAPAFWNALVAELALRKPLTAGEGRSTVAFVDGRAYAVSAQAVTRSDGQSAPRGALVFARAFDAAVLGRFETALGHRLALEPVDAGAAPASGTPTTLEPAEHGRLAATTLYRDGAGRPAALLEFVVERPLVAEADRSVAFVAAVTAVLALLMALLAHFLTSRVGRSLEVLSEAEFDRTFVAHMAEGIVLVDPSRGTIVRTNDAAERLFGGMSAAEAARWLGQALGGFTGKGEAEAPRETQLGQSGGAPVDVELVAQTIRRGEQETLCVVLRDVSERKRVEHRIRHQAYHDGLTQLPNRALFHDRLAVALAQTRRTEEKVGVLLLDLDHFKTINDTLGHDHGDELLMQVSERLRRCVRDGDTIARLGGDEFVVLLPRLTSPADAGLVAERILNALRAPYHLGDREVHISSSIGVAVHPEDGDSPSTLFRNADLAMYHAKQQGRNAWVLHDPSMNEQAADLLELKTELMHALRNEEFFLELQPQVDGVAGQLVGFEALVRWRSPKRGIVPPGRFIPVAEETGLIVAVGEWVLRAACKQVREWLDAGLPAVRVAVNFSARQFLERDLVAQVRRTLEETRCPPQLVEVEVTESIAMKHADRSVAALRAFREMGLGVALDDFGTGYSSLAYLRQFPLDRLKMDRAFIKAMTDSDNSRTMVESIVALSHSLGLEVCAEGVETGEQLALLRSLGCDLLQGFGLARPMPSAEATALLAPDHTPRWAPQFADALSPQASAARLGRVLTSLH